MEEHDPNYIGGDIAAGAASLWQLLARPVLSPDPWRTPASGVYLASSSLRHEFGITRGPDLSS